MCTSLRFQHIREVLPMINVRPRRPISLERKTQRIGWMFIIPALALVVLTHFYPMFETLLLSLQSGKANNLKWAGMRNYVRLFKDATFLAALENTLFYLVVQIPVMLSLALILAVLVNDRKLKGRGIYRTLIFLPAVTSLASCSIIFLRLFANDGYINTLLLNTGVISEYIDFLANKWSARAIIILVMTWRWTGTNMIYFLSGLQNIDDSLYEAAAIDGATGVQAFTRITMPLLKATLLLTTITSTTGTMKLFDEVYNITGGGPANGTITLSNYLYQLCFGGVPQYGYASAIAYIIFLIAALLAFIQMKVGDKE